LVQDRGGAEFKTGGILLYVEDFKRGSNKDIGPKDIFEIGSILFPIRIAVPVAFRTPVGHAKSS
jgi:hypothetical protein